MACGKLATLGDHLLLLLVVAPLVSVNWRGMFFLTDIYVFPDDPKLSWWFTCILGYVAVFLCHVIHDRLTQLASLTDMVYHPLARLYSILLIIIIVFQWRGFWYILDDFFGTTTYSSGFVCLAIGVALSAVSGCSKSITGVVPFILIADDKTNYFIAVSKYQHISHQNPVWHLADHVYSVFFIHPAVIILWRGAWYLQDFGIYPAEEDVILSGGVSFGVGIIGAIAFYILQWPVNEWVKGLPKVWRFLVEQFWRSMTVIFAIFYWRGSWVFFDYWLQKDLFTMWFVTILSAFLLCVLNTWSIATLRGVWVDDPLDSKEDSIVFDIHYFRQIVETIRAPVVEVRQNEKYEEKPGVPESDKLVIEYSYFSKSPETQI